MRALRGLVFTLIVVAVAASAGAGKEPSLNLREPGGRLHPAPADRVALRAVSDCDQLRSYIAEVTLDTLIEAKYFWGGWLYLPWAGPEDGANSGSPTSYTTTNVQESGVDELDIVKTDGSFVYTTAANELLTLASWPPEETRLLSRLELGDWAWGLFLHDDLALVVSAEWSDWVEVPYFWSGTRLDLVDLSDRANPRVLRTITVDGDFVGARMIDGQAYVVLRSYMTIPDAAWELIWRDDLGLPEVDWDATQEEREAAAAVAREILRPLVEELIASLPLEEILPVLTDATPDEPAPDPVPLVSCSDVFLPAESSAYSMLGVLHLDLGAPSPADAAVDTTAVLADGWTVYASAANLYVAQASWWSWWGWGDLELTSAIHKFELGDPDDPVRYVASGEVDGWLLDQFAMSEHDGYLRVASTLVDWWWETPAGGDEEAGAAVTILADDGDGRLETAGRLGGIAPGEQIYAVRFIGDLGYVVTFRQIDPLFTVDLSDPTDPRLVGKLEMPGYSAYLHPVDDGHLLAVGMHGKADGTVDGLAVNLFDVSDPADPRLDAQYVLEDSSESWSWSEVLADHHAFTFDRGVLSLPIYVGSSSWETGWQWFSGLEVLRVDLEDGISELGRVDHSDFAGPEWQAVMRRSLYIDDALYSLSDLGLKVSELFQPDVTLAEVPFYASSDPAPIAR